MLAGLGALPLRWLGPVPAMVYAAGYLPFNLLVLPRLFGGRALRPGERAGRVATGAGLYAVAIVLLVVAFHRRLEVAAGAWGILAAGDGLAAVVGPRVGGRRLPWNPGKSWVGSTTYVLAGGLAAAGLLVWTAPGRHGPGFALASGLFVALYAAVLDSLPVRLDDNLRVPPLAALLLLGLLEVEGGWRDLLAPERLMALGGGLLAGAVLGVVALAARLVRPSGAAAGAALLAVMDWGLGAPGAALFLLFFVLGTGFTLLGFARKTAARVAEGRGGRRGARNALANAGVPAACSLLAAAAPSPDLLALAFAGALAAAAADTAESELGVLGRGRTVLITTWRPVPRGTDGGISLAGSLAGAATAALMAAAGCALGLYPARAVAPIATAGWLATFGESLIGATLERRGLLDNEWVNFINGHLGALMAPALAALARVTS